MLEDIVYWIAYCVMALLLIAVIVFAVATVGILAVTTPVFLVGLVAAIFLLR